MEGIAKDKMVQKSPRKKKPSKESEEDWRQKDEKRNKKAKQISEPNERWNKSPQRAVWGNCFIGRSRWRILQTKGIDKYTLVKKKETKKGVLIKGQRIQEKNKS
jgi:hypothetical protein